MTGLNLYYCSYYRLSTWKNMGLTVDPAICYLVTLGMFLNPKRFQFLTCENEDHDDDAHFVGFKGRGNRKKVSSLKETNLRIRKVTT
jgi:hypothetical protein